MDGAQTRRTDGEEDVLTAAAVEELGARLGSRPISPDDPGYDDARRVWNGMIDRRPALVAGCRGVADVIASVRFAREHRLLLAVRGGGHNVAGFGTCDGGLVVDLSAMRGVRVDPTTKTVRVGGGATWADVDRETQVFGLAVPGGIVSTTGVGGLTLGGGQGWLRRTYGMACDSLVSADVVTADGELVTASEIENADLFWALRGGGGNFGVVTSFEFRAHPVGPLVAFAGPAYPLESAAAVIAAMRSFAAGAPDEVNLSATRWSVPPVAGFPEDLHGRPVIILGAVYVGPPEEGERILQPLREIEQPLLDLSATLPYTALQQMFDPFFPARELHYYWKSIYLAGLGEEVVKTLADHVAARPSPMSMAGLWALGGALGRADPTASASGARDAPFLLEILANWDDPMDSDTNIAWARALFTAMEPHGTGKTNLNFPGLGEEPELVRAAFGDGWSRLVEVKRKYDPTNLFRLNQNIDPRG
ncbi:MAG TPA: FAD-binding oxidoreductase [Thermoanaerobaculia bacterium]|nr:FAD-binding oxidoreductase [Thermoanaerobaculia bacterium]